MKFLPASLVLLSVFLVRGDYAQSEGRIKRNSARSQMFMDAYTALPAEREYGNEKTLVEIDMRELEPTADNVVKVQRLLAAKTPQQDKVYLARILGRLYTEDNRSGQNIVILRELKGLIYNGDHELAQSALLSFSRLPYQNDVLDLLSYGLRSNIISEDIYCRELALVMLPDAPAQAQVAAANTLVQLNNERGAEVLATVFNSQGAVSKLATDARKLVLSALTKREPMLPMALGQFGFFSGTRYASWLHSVALLTESTGGQTYRATVLRYLDEDDIDPRKILAYLSSNYGTNLMMAGGHRAPFSAAADRGFAFADRFPGHQGMSLMVHDIRNTLAMLRE